MRISVIIPTYQAAVYLPGLMGSLKGQSLFRNPDYQVEILVVDSSSSDGSLKLAESLGAKTLSVPKEAFDHGGTRSFAGKLTKADILIYMTQDALPSGLDSLENLIKPFFIPNPPQKTGAVYGRQLPYSDASLFSAHSRGFIYPDKSFVRSYSDRDKYQIKTAFLSNAFSAYSREAMEEIGWFKDNLISTEDTYAGAKMQLAGYRLAYAANAAVIHSHNYTVMQEFKRYFDIGSFHKSENWIVEAFGGAGGEGMKYVLSEWKYLLSHFAILKIPEFLLRNAAKWIGYKLGYNYHMLPYKLRLKLSMHSGWWVKNHLNEGK